MTTEIQQAKKQLIDLMCKEAKRLINSHKSMYSKIGWVDYIHGDNLDQYIFTCAYLSMDDEVILVEKENSEKKTNLKMNEVDDIEKLEWILKGLKEQN